MTKNNNIPFYKNYISFLEFIFSKERISYIERPALFKIQGKEFLLDGRFFLFIYEHEFQFERDYYFIRLENFF